MSRLSGLIAVAALAALGSAPASAAPVTQCGPTICYSYDDAQAAVGLFGTPTLVGDALVFLPPSFRAESTGTEGPVTTTANFIFDEIYAANGVTELSNITVFESGDYNIIETSGAVNEVTADVLLSVVNNEPGPPLFPGGPAIPETGTALGSFAASGDSGGVQEWDMLAVFDPVTEFEENATSVRMSLQNNLFASSDQALEEAWIQKKITLVATVPVPAAVWLFLSGLGLLAGMRRIRS